MSINSTIEDKIKNTINGSNHRKTETVSSSSDSNNNSEETDPSSLAELQTINKYNKSLTVASTRLLRGGGIKDSPSHERGQGVGGPLRRCTTDENSLASIHNHQGLEGKKKLSVVLIALVDQLAAAYEQDEERRKIFSQEICKSLIALDLLHPTFLLQQMEGLRAQYSVAFRRLVLIARDKLPSNRNSLPALMGPEHNLAISVIKLNTLYKLSRYKEDFIEEGKLGHGGFGVVYRARNKLDNATYAVKKVYVKIAKEELVLKIFREVTVFAKVSHTNIVGYKNAWLEPCVVNGTGEMMSSSSSSTGSEATQSSPPIQTESAGADSFSIQFAAELSSNQPQVNKQYQHYEHRRTFAADASLFSAKKPPDTFINIPQGGARNYTVKEEVDLSYEVLAEDVFVDVANDVLLDGGSGDGGMSVPLHSPTAGHQPQKARVQILEELNGTPPDWSEMERVVGRPSRLSDTESSINFQNRNGPHAYIHIFRFIPTRSHPEFTWSVTRETS
jgi:hypothetical protein